MAKELFGVSVHCTYCHSEKVVNIFKNYNKEIQAHEGL